MDGQAALWAAVLASGVYHGLNPGMGWPLAVAAGLTEGRGAAVARTLAPLAAGHLASVALVLLPFAAVGALLEWSREIRIGAGLGIVAVAAALLLYPRHPRWVARLGPRRVALWSFAVALLHGAGLMLAPMLLGLCAPSSGGGPVSGGFAIAANAGLALGVALAHTAALVAAGGAIAWIAYRAVGLRLLRRWWLDLGAVWAASLALAGGLGVWSAV